MTDDLYQDYPNYTPLRYVELNEIWACLEHPYCWSRDHLKIDDLRRMSLNHSSVCCCWVCHVVLYQGVR